AWPFAILRSYGSHASNPRFTERVFAAQERHPGLIEEIWFSGGARDNFAAPEEFGAGAARDNLSARARCEKLGIAFSYQQGVTLNHDPDDRPHPGFPDDCWAVDRAGKIRKGLFCCTSPFARDYAFRKASAILAALKPDSYWPDDDLRLSKLGWSRPNLCFCDRCLKLFSGKTGRAFTRETLLAALDGPKAEASVRRAWSEFNGEQLGEYAKSFRKAVDAASPKTRLGIQIALSANTIDGDSWKTVLEAFAGPGGKAGTRPGGLHYTDRAPREMLAKMDLVAREAARSGDLPCCGQICYEIENWPHVGANKNPNAMMAECALAIAVGCDSIALYWGADQNGQADANYDYWFDCVAKWKPFWLAARDAFRGAKLGGLATYHGSNFFATPGWAWHDSSGIQKLAENAVPWTVAEAAPCAWHLDATALETLGADDLPKVFAKPVFVDAATFQAIKEKFPSLAFTKKLDVRFLSGERALATAVRSAGYETFPSGLKAEGVRALLFPRAADVRTFSGMTADAKAAGTALVPTEFGGKVVVAQYATFGHPHFFWPDGRRRAALDALDAAVPGKMPARLLTDGYSVVVACRVRADGSPAGVMLFNLGAGETQPLELALRGGAASWSVLAPGAKAAEPLSRVGGAEGETVVRVPPMAALAPVLIVPAL
ncbi:MAG: hypothetical protein MJ138_08180, partial [Kiritimatiellae bacterium]|nr:hypothetical protein [Kiritimatiellia bacterium]